MFLHVRYHVLKLWTDDGKEKQMKRKYAWLSVLIVCLGLLINGCGSPSQTEGEETAAKTPSQTTAAEITSTEQETVQEETAKRETEILIIGGGLAGMRAAMEAKEAGAQVLLLEKMGVLGGAGTLSSGATNSCGSEFEKQKEIEDSAELLKEDILKAGNGYNIEWMVDTFVAHTGETFDWLVEAGVEYTDPTPSEEHTANRVFLSQGSGAALTQKVAEKMAEQDVEVLLKTQAVSLLRDEQGAVIGCMARQADGTELEIHAEAVLLATGGYGANEELLTDLLKNAPYYGFAGSTGDGHIMAQEAGAKLTHMEFGKVYPAGWQYEEGKARIQTGYDNYAFATTGAICVTSEGVRAFREGGYNADFKNAILNDSQGLVYMLLDQASYTAWREMVLTNTMGMMTTEEALDELIEAQGDAPQVIYQAETLEELAQKAGMDAKVLEETVERYNGFVKNGVDEDFQRTTLPAEIGEGPYTLVAQYLRFATTIGGVEINESFEVLDEQGEAIDGLYAAGEIVYGLHGNDTIQGSPIGWALISGKLAAEAMLQR